MQTQRVLAISGHRHKHKTYILIHLTSQGPFPACPTCRHFHQPAQCQAVQSQSHVNARVKQLRLHLDLATPARHLHITSNHVNTQRGSAKGMLTHKPTPRHRRLTQHLAPAGNRAESSIRAATAWHSARADCEQEPRESQAALDVDRGRYFAQGNPGVRGCRQDVGTITEVLLRKYKY